MAAQLVNNVKCPYCGQMFAVNTEDIEWEVLHDAGLMDNNPSMHEFHHLQDVTCSYCKKRIDIAVTAIGESQETIESVMVEVITK